MLMIIVLRYMNNKIYSSKSNTVYSKCIHTDNTAQGIHRIHTGQILTQESKANHYLNMYNVIAYSDSAQNLVIIDYVETFTTVLGVGGGQGRLGRTRLGDAFELMFIESIVCFVCCSCIVSPDTMACRL